MLYLILATIFVSVLAAVAWAARRYIGEPASAAAGGSSSAQAFEEVEYEGPSLPGWIEGLSWLGERVPLGGDDRRAISPRLAAAGFRQEWAAEVFYGAKAVGMVAPPAILLFVCLLSGSDAVSVLLVCLFGSYLGLTAPDRYLRRRTAKRREQLRRGLPDFLDLLVLAVESGLSLDQAVANTAKDLARTHPALADEFSVMTREIMAGTERAEALRHLGTRSKEPEIRKLASMLIQTDRFGSSVSKVLRTQARYMRIKRRQRAEEEAHKVGVKIIFPVFLLIMPAVFLITAGPAVILLLGNLDRMSSSF